MRILAYKPALVRADGVEISQKHNRPFVIRRIYVAEHDLLKIFARAVRVGRAAYSAVLVERQPLGRAVHRSRRREHYFFATVFSHHVEKYKRTVKVIVVIFDRLCHRLAYGFQSREMNDEIYFMLGKNLFERIAVAYVGFVKAHFFTRDLFHTRYAHGRRIVEVIDNYDVVPFFQ